MLFRKDFLFLTKPLYESEFSGKTWKPPTLATVKDFLRFHAATSKGKIQEEQILFQKLLANFLHIHQCQIIVKVSWVSADDFYSAISALGLRLLDPLMFCQSVRLRPPTHRRA